MPGKTTKQETLNWIVARHFYDRHNEEQFIFATAIKNSDAKGYHIEAVRVSAKDALNAGGAGLKKRRDWQIAEDSDEIILSNLQKELDENPSAAAKYIKYASYLQFGKTKVEKCKEDDRKSTLSVIAWERGNDLSRSYFELNLDPLKKSVERHEYDTGPINN